MLPRRDRSPLDCAAVEGLLGEDKFSGKPRLAGQDVRLDIERAAAARAAVRATTAPGCRAARRSPVVGTVGRAVHAR